MNRKRKDYLSELRALACLGVVILHTIRLYFSRSVLAGANYTAAGCVKDLMDFAVPCFLMVSGALLLDPDKDLSLRKIWGKYVLKVFLCLAVFTAVFTCFDAFADHSFAFPGILLAIGENLWKDGSWAHLWYLYMLIGIYAMLPLYRILARYAGRKELLYLLTVWTVFLVILPMAGTAAGVRTGFTIGTSSVFPMCLFLGFVLEGGGPGKTDGGVRDSRPLDEGVGSSYLPGKCIWFLLLAGGGLTVLCSVAAYRYELEIAKSMISTYAFLPVLMLSAGVFAGWKRVSPRLPGKCKAVLSAADRSSFGIYLIHLLTLRVFHMTATPKHLNLAGVIGIALLVFGISWIGTWIGTRYLYKTIKAVIDL